MDGSTIFVVFIEILKIFGSFYLVNYVSYSSMSIKVEGKGSRLLNVYFPFLCAVATCTDSVCNLLLIIY